MNDTITLANRLIRRVPEQPSYVERDEVGRPQLTSAVFKYAPSTMDDGVSVDVLEIWLTLGTREAALYEAAFRHFTKSGVGHSAAILLAAVPLHEGLICKNDPLPASKIQSANPAHALILGKINKTLAHKLAKACELVERPSAVAALS